MTREKEQKPATIPKIAAYDEDDVFYKDHYCTMMDGEDPAVWYMGEGTGFFSYISP